MDAPEVKALIAKLETDDDAAIYVFVRDHPDVVGHFPQSDQHRIETAIRRSKAMIELDRLVDADTAWKTAADDQAIVDAWRKAVELGCSFTSAEDAQLNALAGQSRLRLLWERPDEPRPDPGQKANESTDSARATSTERNAARSRGEREIELDIALLHGDRAAIRAAADALVRENGRIPPAFEDAVARSKYPVRPGNDDAPDFASEAMIAIRNLANTTGRMRFKYVQEIARATTALSAIEAFGEAQAAGNVAGTARAWSKLHTCWPGLLSPAADAAGKQAFEQHGRDLLAAGH